MAMLERSAVDTADHPGQGRLRGLTDAEVLASRKAHGSNVLTPPPRDPWWRLFLEKFEDPVIRILMIAAALAIGVGAVHGNYIEGVGIVVAILLATTLAFVNEYQAQKEFDVLNQSSDHEPVDVVRNGVFCQVPRSDLVVGDLVILKTGDAVPADGCILEAVSLMIDEASLTGESEPANKVVASPGAPTTSDRTYPQDRAFRGTLVKDGHGAIELLAVGNATEIGKVVIQSQEETGEITPLNEQLSSLSKAIGVVGFSIAGLTFLALVVRGVVVGEFHLTFAHWGFTGLAFAAAAIIGVKVWLPTLYDGLELVGRPVDPPAWLEAEGAGAWLKPLGLGAALLAAGVGAGVGAGWLDSSPSTWIPANFGAALLAYFMIAVTIIVVAVPEGLAMSVTLSLAYSMRKMTATNNLVRQMKACETIGAATVICSDKTGTLTMNEMRVHAIEAPALTSDGLASEGGRRLVEAIAANSTANLGRTPGQPPKALGNPTEGALLLWLDDQGVDYLEARNRFNLVSQLTFSTERKFMGTVGYTADTGERVVYLKGAPEIVAKRCTHVLTSEGLRPFAEHAGAIHAALVESQGRAMRTLGLAYRPTPDGEGKDVVALAQGLVWLGFAAIADPIREEVPPAVAACKTAGIQVKIVTGDNAETAREIARRAGVIDAASPAEAILAGPDFAAMSDDQARSAIDKLRVLVRARPSDKMRLVKLLQEQDHVVAVTGDGTNDAPALHHANVGVSMGKTGTSVAKEASDIVLLDDSFASLVNAVMWGRSLYQNIQRFILFQLTINVAALVIALLGPFIGIGIPLTVVQMLWINLIMDTFAALALATEPPDPTVLRRPPRNWKAFIVSPAMAKGIFGVGALFVAVLLAFLFIIKEGGVTPYELTLFFNTFVMLQFWNMFNARRLGSNASALTNLGESKPFLVIAAAIFFGQIAIVQWGGDVFRVTPLGLRDWAIIVGATSVVLWAGEALRFVGRQRAAVA